MVVMTGVQQSVMQILRQLPLASQLLGLRLLKEMVGELAGASQQGLLLALALLPHGSAHIKHPPLKGCICSAAGFQKCQRDV